MWLACKESRQKADGKQVKTSAFSFTKEWRKRYNEM